MADNSNPNHRPINVVTFLAAHPTEVFSLADISRQLGLSKGSAHRVMTALTETGFVSRHPRHKTYSLGMALVAIGQAALERYPGIEIARREMTRLSTELNAGFAASAIMNNEYFLLAREGMPQSYDGLTLVGERRYLVPPIGVGQLAWRSDAEIGTYLNTGAAFMTPAIKAHMKSAFPLIRRRGYSTAANGLAMHALMHAAVVPIGRHPGPIPDLVLPKDQPEITLQEFQLLALGDAGSRGVNYLAAPVFTSEGEICFEIVMSGFPLDLSDVELEQYAARLVMMTEAITKEVRGRKPTLW